MQKQINILFLALHHRINDPRLFYREINAIKTKMPGSQVFILTVSNNSKKKHVIHSEETIFFQEHKIIHIDIKHPTIKKNSIIGRLQTIGLKAKIFYAIVSICRDLKLDIIQASDARELFITNLTSKVCNCKIIYDSHEDYFRQFLDYKGGYKNYILAYHVLLSEILYVRCFSAVFCTDEFLLQKYNQKLYGAKNVNLLRNYPYFLSSNERIIKNQDTLRLVYIGGVNKYRGVIECAKYVEIFNHEFSDKKLVFDIYSPKTAITENLKQKEYINHIEWIDYIDLMNKLYEYDIGICLWLPIKKFYRNLPLKNFDYMATGLPIITSNFGNLLKYMKESQSGICINPNSYQEFKEAILQMFDPNIRKKYSANGFTWVREHGSFEIESKEYINIIQNLTL